MRPVTVDLADADAGAGGRAMLRFLGVGAPPAPDLTVAVWCTDPAAPWLGPHGWQSTEHYFRPESAEAQGQDLVLVVGREIVDNIADFTIVEVQLPEQGVRAAVSWQDVTRSYTPEIAAGPRAKPVTETFSPPPPPPPPVVDEEPARPPPVPEPLPPPAPAASTPPDPPTRRSIWPLLAAALLLVAAAGAGYWYFDRELAPTDPERADTGQIPPAITPPPAEDTPERQPAAETPEQQLAKARTAIEAGDVETARPLLRRLDAAHFAPAQLYWAGLVDSVDFQPGLLREPDDLRAVDLYAAACAGGVAEAKQRLGELAQSLEARSSSGDSFAAELLRGPLRDIRDKCP